MADFDLDSFLVKLDEDKTPERTNDGNYLRKIVMSSQSNQGHVSFVPFVSKKAGNIYLKLEGVQEYYGPTSIINSKEGWYKILPKNMYGELSKLQSELYDEVAGLYKTVEESGKLDWNQIRTRRYSIFYGILVKHVNTKGEEIADNVDKPVILIFPSSAPIDALNEAVSAKQLVLKDRTKAWISQIITPSNTGRKGVMVISFKKPNSPGYNSSVSFELNDEFTQIVDPNRVFDDSIVANFDDPLREFLGWQYDNQNKSYFNETAFRELRDALKVQLGIFNVDARKEQEEKKDAEAAAPATPESPAPATAPVPESTGLTASGKKPPF